MTTTDEPERILCAAIWVDTGEPAKYRNSYAYPETGLLFAGQRHSDCFTTLLAWARALAEDKYERVADTLDKHQGFLTSKGRFVDRQKAWIIAHREKQIVNGHVRPVGVLTSEHLY